jgi:hypothetical protein
MSFIAINGYEIDIDFRGRYTIDGKPCRDDVTWSDVLKAIGYTPAKELERIHEAFSEERNDRSPVQHKENRV